MDLKINDTKEVKALERKELSGMVSFEGATPSKDDLKKQIASQVKASEDVVVVKLIKNVFGKTKAVFNAYVYDKPEVVETYERKTRKERRGKDKPAEESKPAAEKAPKPTEKAAEKPKEEKEEAKEAEAKPTEKKEAVKEEPPKEEKKEE